MMRQLIAILLICSPELANAADKPRRKTMPACMSFEKYNRLAARLEAHSPYITAERLPARMKIGRCLFEVDGKRLISGKCAYSIGKDGGVEINGPRQIYGGIDYPDCFTGAATFTTDYFVQVDWNVEKELNDGSSGPGWEAYWNGQIGSNHAEWFLRSVKKSGACYSNDQTKICLWKQ
jgi:hypothetical protein